jgi:tetratricopeptide (TPR) repeat protein
MRKLGRVGWAWHNAVLLTILLALLGTWIATSIKGILWAAIGAGVLALAGWVTPLLIDSAHRKEEALEAARRTEKGIRYYGPAQMLDPVLGVVPFTGRTVELGLLEAWCEDGRSGVLRLVTGSGGSGKTRLALELTRRMQERGWLCVQVAEAKIESVLERQRAIAPRAGLLLVVDYAETLAGLDDLLESAARDTGWVRVLLLARHAGDWWQRLQGGSGVVRDAVRDANSSVIELNSELDPVISMAEMVWQAVPYFAKRLGVPVPDTQAMNVTGSEKPRILDLHAAALVAVLYASDQAGDQQIQVNADMVLEELLSHEKHYWRGRAESAGLLTGPDGLSMAQLSQVAAVGCLLGISTAEELNARVPGICLTESGALWLRELYPPEDDGALGVIRPDRLAELHVSRELGATPALAHACLTNLNPDQARRALVLLARASVDHPVARSLLESSLEQFSTVIDGIAAPREVLISIAGAIPLPSLAYAKAHSSIIKRIADTFPPDTAERAQWLNALSVLLRDLGRREEALETVNEVVTILRSQPDSRLDSFETVLVAALNNQSNCLADLARPDDAVAVIEEAITICREVIDSRLDDKLPDLAMTLNNQSLRLADLGRYEEAQKAIGEAVIYYRRLAGARPGSYADLAMAIHNQSLRFADLGKRAEALAALEEAITIYQRLTDTWPDAYLPNIGGSLNNKSALLLKFGHPEESLTTLEKAIAIYRRLADFQPEAYLRNLAGMLETRSSLEVKLGRSMESLESIREAVKAYRSLPELYLPDRAIALKQLIFGLSVSQLWEESADAMDEAVAVYGKLAEAKPDAYLHEFAATLDLQASLFRMLGQWEKALPAIRGAIVAYRTLANAQPTIFLPNLAARVCNQSVCLENLGRMEEALAAIEQAAAIYHPLAHGQPGAFSTIYEKTLAARERISLALKQEHKGHGSA